MNLIGRFTFVFILASFVLTADSIAQSSAFEDALNTASALNKRVIVDFYTDWCKWCRKMDAESYNDSTVKQTISDNFVLVRINAEGLDKLTYNGKQMTYAQFAQQLKVSGYPTTVFFEPDGSLISFDYNKQTMHNVPGYFPASDFEKLLNYVKDGKYKDTDLSTIM